MSVCVCRSIKKIQNQNINELQLFCLFYIYLWGYSKSKKRIKLWFYLIFATLGPILDSQLSWHSGKHQLARWSLEVEIFPERNHPSTRPYGFSCFNILPDSLKWNVRYISPPLKHLRPVCGVLTLVWTNWNVRCPVSLPYFEYLTRCP